MEKEPLPRIIKHLYFSSRYFFTTKFGDRLPNPDISAFEGSVLSYITFNFPEAGATPSDLMGHYHIAKSTISETMKGLTKKGYLETRLDQTDKRKKRYFPTEEAKVHVENMKPIFEEFDRDVNGILTEEEADLFREYAEKILKAMERRQHDRRR